MKSKLAIIIYIILALFLLVGGYFLYKKQNNKTSPTTEQTNSGDSTTTLSGIDNLTDDNNAENGETDQTDNQPSVDNSSPADSSTANNTDTTVSPTKTVTGSALAHITPEHCDNNCQAFANDLKLLEYCEQSCGISPIKDVSDCDGKSGLEKDYCLKDMAINDEDPTVCDQIKDANIKQSCQNRIQQDFIENQQ